MNRKKLLRLRDKILVGCPSPTIASQFAAVIDAILEGDEPETHLEQIDKQSPTWLLPADANNTEQA